MEIQYSVYQLFALFLVYSFLGWCVEVCFVAVTSGKVVNRGFLNGPVCPIYGVGMIAVLVILEPISDRVPMLFFGGMVLCSLVELAGGWILARVFDTRWWDYSDKPFNLGGYICLGFSLMWGLAVTFAVKLIHPPILVLIDSLPRTMGLVLLIVLYALFAADLTVTLVTIVGIKRRLKELDRVAGMLHTVGDSISGKLGNTALAADARLDELKESGQEMAAESRQKVSAAIAASQEMAAEGREKLAAAIAAGQEKAAEGREKVSAAIAAGQEKAAEGREKVSAAIAERQEKAAEGRQKLEARQRQLLRELRNRFSYQRLTVAFPDIRKILQDHMDNMDKE